MAPLTSVDNPSSKLNGSASLTTHTSQALVAEVTMAFLIASVPDSMLSYTRNGCDHQEIRRSSALHTEMTQEELVHVPQVLPLEGQSESGLFDGFCAQPVSRLTGTVQPVVELIVELVVNLGVSCCPLDHFVSDSCGTGAVIIFKNMKKSHVLSLGSSVLARSSLILESDQGSKRNLKGKESRIYGRTGEYCVATARIYLDQDVARAIQDFQWTSFSNRKCQ